MHLTINLAKLKKLSLLIIFILLSLVIAKSIINYIFPTKYEHIVNKYAKEYGINPVLVFSVINAESRFKVDAISNKGAIGLMQIMPDTGIWLAKKIDKTITTQDLFNPEINIQLGCFYIQYLLNLHKDEMLALCAYNAGSTNVNRWLANDKYAENGTIHTIPFNETKKYVKKINIFKIGYSTLLKINNLIK